MSSRTENGDTWRQLEDRTADRGPGSTLPSTPRDWPGSGVSVSGRPAGPGRKSSGGPAAPGEENAGWSVFSYLIAGMAVYGGIGWLVGHWLHVAILFPLGMLAGLVLAIVLIIYRYGRP